MITPLGRAGTVTNSMGKSLQSFLLRPFPRKVFFRFLGRFGGVDAKDHNDLLAVATGDLPVFEAGDDIRVF